METLEALHDYYLNLKFIYLNKTKNHHCVLLERNSHERWHVLHISTLYIGMFTGLLSKGGAGGSLLNES